jgi:predicted transposase/invertase (TIGR01784 family)
LWLNLTPVEMNEYQQRLKIQRDNYSALSCARKEGFAEGLELGKAERRLELGEHKKAIEIAIKLKAKNTSVEEISEITGLSYEEIEAL